MPHQKITRAALDALPKNVLARFGDQAGALSSIYCLYPDRYTEMTEFGFVRKSEGPKSPEEIRAYCVRPDGGLVHGATGDRDTDMESLIFLFERMLSSFAENRPVEAAKYAGVLAHFVEDSLSPPHAEETAPAVHHAIERSVPEFSSSGWTVRAPRGNLLEIAQTELDRIYAGREANRKDLPAMTRAVAAGDDRTLDGFRRRAAVEAAQILAELLMALGESAR